MVSGKNSEAAGIYRQAFMKPKFRGKVSNLAFLVILLGELPVVPGLKFHVPVEVALNALKMRNKTLVFGKLFKPVLADGAQKPYWVVIAFFPELAVHSAKEFHRFAVPYPPEVIGYLKERFHLFRQGRYYHILPGIFRQKLFLIQIKHIFRHFILLP